MRSRDSCCYVAPSYPRSTKPTCLYRLERSSRKVGYLVPYMRSATVHQFSHDFLFLSICGDNNHQKTSR